MEYSPGNPSPRYIELLELYKKLHEEGDKDNARTAEQTYAGHSLLNHVQRIKGLIERTGSNSMLDYGSGKGMLYTHPLQYDPDSESQTLVSYWDIDELRCYDPAYEPYSKRPEKKYDGVICTDMVEHCPEDDLPWIIREIFSFASRFVYINAACYPAVTLLPNGENAHCTVKPPEWWGNLAQSISSDYPDTIWEMATIVKTKGIENKDAELLVYTNV